MIFITSYTNFHKFSSQIYLNHVIYPLIKTITKSSLHPLKSICSLSLKYTPQSKHTQNFLLLLFSSFAPPLFPFLLSFKGCLQTLFFSPLVQKRQTTTLSNDVYIANVETRCTLALVDVSCAHWLM